MNIDRINSSNILGIYKKNQSENQKIDAQKAAGRDDVVLSESGKVFNLALKAVKEEPDIRTDMVKEIASQIKSGEYTVKKEELADKLLSDAFFIIK